MNHQQKKLCETIMNSYSNSAQEIQAVQELSELICVLTRRPEQRDSMDFKESVKDEIADCLIMIEQMRQLYDISDTELSERIDAKLDRQVRRTERHRPSDDFQGWKQLREDDFDISLNNNQSKTGGKSV